MNACSYCLSLVLATISAITFGIDVWLGYDAAMGNKLKNISRNTQIQPPDWLIMVWDVIYVLFVVWYLYVFLILFRQMCCGRNKSPLFPGIFWLIFIIINVLNGFWIHFCVKGYMILTGIILAVLCLMLYLINMIAFRVCWFDVTYDKSNNNDNDVEENSDDIVQLSRCEVVLLRFTTLNGLPLYAMWCTLATALEWTMIFQYHTFHWSSTVSSLVTLAILTFCLLIYWTMDLITLRKYFVYTWLPCILLVVTFSAIIAKYNSIGGDNRPALSFVFALLIATCVAIAYKLFSLCCCPPKYQDPRFSRV